MVHGYLLRPKNVRNLHSTLAFLYVSYFDIFLIFIPYYVDDMYARHCTDKRKEEGKNRRITASDRLLIMHIINRTLFRLPNPDEVA